MTPMRSIPGFFVAVVVALTLTPAGASAQYSIPRSVIASGGVVNSSGGGYTMGATIGQPVIGWTSGAGLNLHQGFWFPLPNVPASVDVPIVAVGGARNWPNPFSTSTTIYYALPERSHVNVVVFNAAGDVVRHLVSGDVERGEQNIMWDGLNDDGERAGAGMYVFVVDARSQGGKPTLYTRGKMVVVR